ncbi:exodeoxyribonuclease III [Candidatus Woesearchaeota archaeon]|jgi:exodeoxyribonuclease-3|nr:exodeoxyribonuclease III [Candidatus Woesearchaeota archaeon]
MKIISWNVNGIRAALKKGFIESMKKENPDIICIQETKAHPDQVDMAFNEYEHHFWNSAEKKGYSGTAIFSKIKPLSITYGLGIEEHDTEGRLITLEFDDFFLINTYVPNSGRGPSRLSYRQKWDKDLLKYLKDLEKKKPIIFTGDLNVAHKPIDLKNPTSNYNKTSGYMQEEIDGMDNIIKAGFIDSFREFHKEPNHYTWWSYMFNARANNVGWRLDYFIVSPKLNKKIKDSFILPKIMGSDHCPVVLNLE